MKKKDNKLTPEEVKKQQDKIIFITRIVGVTLFLVGISIIFITAIIRKRDVNVPSDTVIFESAGDSFYLDLNDENLLDEGYIILESMSDYDNFVNSIDTWSSNNYNNFIDKLENNENNTDDYILMEKQRYEDLTSTRVDNIKKLINDFEISDETFNDNVIIVVQNISSQGMNEQNLEDICLNDEKLTIHFSENVHGVFPKGIISLYLIELDKKYADKEIDVVVNSSSSNLPGVDYKPIIYIYPEEEMDVKVKLENEDKLFISYPEYDNSWDVRAFKDGTLIDKKTNRELYSLYYESLNKVDFKVMEDGFVVSSDEIIPFLENKLEILGLNSRESEEFIIYWLPILKKNKYNYIRFATIEEIDENMGLSIEPKPDSIIRVLMTFKGLDEKINVKEQELTPVERKGYSVVEWGGTIIE